MAQKWVVFPTDADTLSGVGQFHEGDLDGMTAGALVELSEDGYLAEFHLYDFSLSLGSLDYDRTVSARLAEPASTYRDVFTTEWDAYDID
jgi:hypothetical protein